MTTKTRQEEQEGVKLVRWGLGPHRRENLGLLPHREEVDPIKGWRGSLAGRERRSRRRATPEQPGGEGRRMNF